MESFLESCILDEIPHSLVKQLSKFVRAKQMEKSSFSRSDAFVNGMMEKYAEWLAEQDVPEPIIRRNSLMIPHARASAGSGLMKRGGSMEKMKISPSMFGRMKPSIAVASPSTEPITTPQHMLRRLSLEDDVFIMDEMDNTIQFPGTTDAGSLPPSASSSASAMPISVSVPVWKASGSTRSVDFCCLIPCASLTVISVWT